MISGVTAKTVVVGSLSAPVSSAAFAESDSSAIPIKLESIAEPLALLVTLPTPISAGSKA